MLSQNPCFSFGPTLESALGVNKKIKKLIKLRKLKKITEKTEQKKPIKPIKILKKPAGSVL